MHVKTAKEMARDALDMGEALRAAQFQMDGILEYVAMMADVDLPEDGGEEDGGGE